MIGWVAGSIAVLLIAYAAIGESLWGWVEYRRLVARRESDPRALVRVYRIVFAVQWSWTALVLLAVAASPGLTLAGIGLSLPQSDEGVWPLAAGFAMAVVASGIAMRRAAHKGGTVPGQAAYAALLPRTRAERMHAAGAAITAGVCEEILYRGFFIAVGVSLFHLPLEWAAVASAAIFLVGHIYQGWAGALGLTALTAVFTLLYLRSGSLLVPIILHALVDLRALLLVPASPAAAGKGD